MPLMPLAGFGWVVIMAVVAVVGAIIGLYALFGKLVPSTAKLAEYDPEFSISATLIKVGYVGGFILLVLGFITLILLIGFFVLIVAAIFLLIGSIGLLYYPLKCIANLTQQYS